MEAKHSLTWAMLAQNTYFMLAPCAAPVVSHPDDVKTSVLGKKMQKSQ